MGNICGAPKQVHKGHDHAYCMTSMPPGDEHDAAFMLCDIICSEDIKDRVNAVNAAAAASVVRAKRLSESRPRPTVFNHDQLRDVLPFVQNRLRFRVDRLYDATSADVVIDLLVRLDVHLQSVLESGSASDKGPYKNKLGFFEHGLIRRREELKIVLQPLYLYRIVSDNREHDTMVRMILPLLRSSVLWERDYSMLVHESRSPSGRSWVTFMIWNVAHLQLLWLKRAFGGALIPEFESDPCAPLFEGQVAHASDPLLFGPPECDMLDAEFPDSCGKRIVGYKTLLRQRVLKCRTERAAYIRKACAATTQTLFGLVALGSLVTNYLPQDKELEEAFSSLPSCADPLQMLAAPESKISSTKPPSISAE